MTQSEYREKLDKIALEAAHELENYGKLSVMQKLKRTAKQVLGRSVAKSDPMFWPAGMLMMGLAEYWKYAAGDFADDGSADAVQSKDLSSSSTLQEVQKVLVSHIDNWMDSGCELQNIDDVLSGCAILDVYKLTGNVRYLDAADAMAEYALKAPKDRTGAVIYRPGRAHDYVFADGVGMMAMFLSKYAEVVNGLEEAGKNCRFDHKVSDGCDTAGSYDGRAKQARAALSEALAQLEIYHKYGFDKTTGLPAHGYEAEKLSGSSYESSEAEVNTGGRVFGESRISVVQKGFPGWGRAVGWYLGGYCEYCRASHGRPGFLEEDIFFRLVESSRKKDGSFPWLLTEKNGESDISATAMISAAEMNLGTDIDRCSHHQSGTANRCDHHQNGTANRCDHHQSGMTNQCDHHQTGTANRCEYQQSGTAECQPGANTGHNMTTELILKNTDADGRVGQTLAECLDFGNHPQVYGNYPWGQGAALIYLCSC